MSANKKYLTVCIVFLIFLAFHQGVFAQETSSQKSQIIYNSVGDVIAGENTDLNQGKGFHTFKINNLEKKYLFFELTPIGESSFLDISMFIYRGNETTPFKVCKKQEVDSCFVPQNDLSKNSQLLVIVDCGSACKYNLHLSWSNIEHLNPGDKLKFMFAQEKSQLYHLELEKAGDFAELRLIIKPETRREMFDKVKIYGKYGTEAIPSADDYDFKSIHLWQDAEGVYLEKNEIKNKTMNILIIGESKTVYAMTCEVVNKTTHDMYPGEALDEYLQPQEVATYHINFTSNGKIQFDQYVFKFAGFNGNMSIAFYMDSDFTKVYTVEPYEYMSDAQFIFPRQQIVSSLPLGIYIKIKSFDRISTYTMEFTGRSNVSSIQLKENIYEITEVEYGKPKVFYFDAFFFENDQTYLDKFSFTLHLINVKGKHGVAVKVCEKELDLCVRPENALNYSKEIKISRYDEIGTKRTFRFQVPKQMLTRINQVEQRITVLVIVESIDPAKSICALQYYSENKFQILRQSRPIESRLKVHETKLYKFTNVDKKIKEIRIHVNKISGLVSVLSLRESPDVQANSKKETSNVISFKDDLTEKPVYLILFAEEDAIISIDVQLIHENSQNIASITMQEDVEFKIKIPPKQVEFLQIHPVYDSIYFDYKASGLVVVCEYIDGKCKTEVPEMGVQGSVEVQKFTGRSEMVMVQNPSEQRTVQFSAIYHSSDYDHCQTKKTGVIYSEVIQSTTCLSFPLTQMDDIEVLITRMDLGNIHTAFLLCNNVIDLKSQDGRHRYTIEKALMEKYCKDKDHKVLLVVVSGVKPTDEDDSKEKQKVIVKAKIIAQYTNQGGIVIPDGVAYETSKIAKQQALQSFYYEVLNKVNTTIILTNKIGAAYFTVKLVRTVDRHKSVNSNAYDFTSNNSNYYMNPVLSISKQFLQKSQCQSECTLIVKVFSKQKIGTKNDFMIEVTQNYVVLQEHKMKDDFLTKDAIAYYSFFNKQSGNSLLIETSDNNKKCTKIILSDREFPSDVNNLQVEYGNQLVLQNAENKTYFIAVEAIQTCAYSISVSSTQTHITHLERGKLGYLKLKQGEVKYFMFHRMTSNPFKILSIHVYGEIDFFMNRTTPESISKLVDSKEIKYEEFKIKGEYKNRLLMEDQLCENCYYILACLAKKNTDTSIFLGDSDSFLSISEKKSVNDQLKHKGDSLKGYYYDIQSTVVKVKVHNGKLGVKLKYFNQTYEKDFAKLDDMYSETIDLKRKNDDWSPASIQLAAIEDDTLYSIRFQSAKSTEFSNMVDETEVSPGEPSYIYIVPERVFCLKGYWRDDKEIIMITADQLYQNGLKEMKIQVVVNGSQLKFDKDQVRNILSLKIPMKDAYVNEGQKYSICLSSVQQSFGATVFQTEDVNILPADVETVAYGPRKYAIRPNGNFLMDVFECIGKANITYSESLKELPNAKANALSILGMPDQPHAFRISEFLTTFIKVDSQMATVRWIPIDEATETGLGYLQYKVGQIKYKSMDDQLEIQWDGLSSKGESHTKVETISYTIYIANETDLLQSAQNCDYMINAQKIMTSIVKGGNHSDLGTVRTYNVKKSDLRAKYPDLENLFVSVVAQVDIQPIRGDLQHYRFFYAKQQIPIDVFTASSNAYLENATYIGVIVAGIVGFLIFTWICTKKIFPMLARLKNRLLVEEDAAQDAKNEQLGDVPPPSSERKAIQNNVATEDKMNDQIQKS